MKSRAFTSILAMLALAVAPSLGTAQTNTFPASGNVGIGTTSPSAVLHVWNSAAANASGQEVARFTAPTSSATLGSGPFITFVNTGSVVLGEIRSNLSSGTQGDLAFYAYNNGLSEVMRLAAGRVGIGTTSPLSKLSVVSTGATDPAYTRGISSFYFPGNNSYGGGFTALKARGTSTSPTAVSSGDGMGGISFGGYDGTNYLVTSGLFASANGAITSGSIPTDLVFGTGSTNTITERMRITSAGNVGIGTTNPTYSLTVNGTVRAQEVIVDTGWSDYVFSPGYRLQPLSELESQIKSEGHLPGIPSAKEVSAAGISVGDMQARLLAKVEELTLHVIAQDKRLAAQEERLSAQSDSIRRLKEENRQLRASR